MNLIDPEAAARPSGTRRPISSACAAARRFPAPASYEIFSTSTCRRRDRARASLGRRAAGTRYEDHLGFVKVDGQWKLLTKVFRTWAGLDKE
jgi:hypothetical protein